MTVAIDTSIIVAGLLSWHEHHRPAAAALGAALESAAPALVPIPALIEAWSVMTRLPAPYRVTHDVAGELLTLSLRDRCRLVGLREDETWRLVARLQHEGWTGKIAFDAHILACASAGGADALLTFNGRDFVRLAAGTSLAIVDPRKRHP